MNDELSFDDRIRRAVNQVTWERWEGKSTQEIVDIIKDSLGEPERINTMDGEVISAYITSRSKP